MNACSRAIRLKGIDLLKILASLLVLNLLTGCVEQKLLIFQSMQIVDFSINTYIAIQNRMPEKSESKKICF